MINTGVIPIPTTPSMSSAAAPDYSTPITATDHTAPAGYTPGVVVGQPHAPTPMVPDGSKNFGIPPPPPAMANTYSGMQTSHQTSPTAPDRNVYSYSGVPHQTAPTRPTGNTYSGYSGYKPNTASGYRPKASGYRYSPSGY